jgi:sarcosine oxidase gamma subunit
VDESRHIATYGVELAGLSVTLRREFKVASLRYFDAQGPIAVAVRSVVGGPLPEVQRAVRYPAGAGELILAWRSPTETWLITTDGAAFAAITAALASDSSAGCLVDQTGGLWAWQLCGARTTDLLARLGSKASIPALGEARGSRVAELPVLMLCVKVGEIVLLVERVYSEHLLGWINETVEDF